MQHQLSSSEIPAVRAAQRLTALVEQWGPRLSGGQFKLMVCVYQDIARNGGKPVCVATGALAETTGLSVRTIETARKHLAEQAIISFKAQSQRCWYGYPECSAEDFGKPPSSETADSAEIAEVLRDADTAAADCAVVTAPVMDSAIGLPVAAESDTACPERVAQPEPAPAKNAVPVLEAAAETAPTAQSPAVTPQTPAVDGATETASLEPPAAPTAHAAPPALPAASAPETARPSQVPVPAGPAPQPMASPARIEDQLLAAMQQVVPNQRITPAAVRQLQRFVSDNALALACLCWMRKVSRSYTNSALLIGAAEFQCLPPGGWQESAFLRANPQSRQKG